MLSCFYISLKTNFEYAELSDLLRVFYEELNKMRLLDNLKERFEDILTAVSSAGPEHQIKKKRYIDMLYSIEVSVLDALSFRVPINYVSATEYLLYVVSKSSWNRNILDLALPLVNDMQVLYQTSFLKEQHTAAAAVFVALGADSLASPLDCWWKLFDISLTDLVTVVADTLPDLVAFYKKLGLKKFELRKMSDIKIIAFQNKMQELFQFVRTQESPLKNFKKLIPASEQQAPEWLSTRHNEAAPGDFSEFFKSKKKVDNVREMIDFSGNEEMTEEAGAEITK